MMKNMNLNIGGIIGGVLGCLVTVGITLAISPNFEEAGRFAILGVLGGAAAGNFLWQSAMNILEGGGKKRSSKKVAKKTTPRPKPLVPLADDE